MSFFKPVVVILFLILILKVHVKGKISDKRLCADSECSVLISEGITLLKYNSASEDNRMSFAPKAAVKVYSKSAGNNDVLWGVYINGQRGYVPKTFIKELKIYQKDLNYEVPTAESGSLLDDQNVENIRKELSSGSKGGILFTGVSADSVPPTPSKVQSSYQVIDGTTIFEDIQPSSIVDTSMKSSVVQEGSVEKIVVIESNTPESVVGPSIDPIHKASSASKEIVGGSKSTLDEELSAMRSGGFHSDLHLKKENVVKAEAGVNSQVQADSSFSNSGLDASTNERAIGEVDKVDEVHNLEQLALQNTTSDDPVTVKDLALERANKEEDAGFFGSMLSFVGGGTKETSENVMFDDELNNVNVEESEKEEEEEDEEEAEEADEEEVVTESSQSIDRSEVKEHQNLLETFHGTGLRDIGVDRSDKKSTEAINKSESSHLNKSHESNDEVPNNDVPYQSIQSGKTKVNETLESKAADTNVESNIPREPAVYTNVADTADSIINNPVTEQETTTPIPAAVDTIPTATPITVSKKSISGDQIYVLNTDAEKKDSRDTDVIAKNYLPSNQEGLQQQQDQVYSGGPVDQGNSLDVVASENEFKTKELYADVSPQITQKQPMHLMENEGKVGEKKYSGSIGKKAHKAEKPLGSSLPPQLPLETPDRIAIDKTLSTVEDAIGTPVQSLPTSTVSKTVLESDEVNNASAIELPPIDDNAHPISDNGTRNGNLKQDNSTESSGSHVPGTSLQGNSAEAGLPVETSSSSPFSESDIITTEEDLPLETATDQPLPENIQHQLSIDSILETSIPSVSPPPEFTAHEEADLKLRSTNTEFQPSENILHPPSVDEEKEGIEKDELSESEAEPWFQSATQIIMGLFSLKTSDSVEVVSIVPENIPEENIVYPVNDKIIKVPENSIYTDDLSLSCQRGEEGCDKVRPLLSDHGDVMAQCNFGNIKYEAKEEMFIEMPSMTTSTLITLIVTAITIIVFSIGNYYIESRSRDGALVAKINALEREMLLLNKEAAARTQELSVAKERILSVGGLSADTEILISTLTLENTEHKAMRLELESRIDSLEKELEMAVDSNLEMNEVLSESLSTQDGPQELLGTVENLKQELENQRKENTSLLVELRQKIATMAELHCELGRSVDHVHGLEIEVSALRAGKEEELLAVKEQQQTMSAQLKEIKEAKAMEESRLVSELSNMRLTLEELEAERDQLRDLVKRLEGPGERLGELLGAAEARTRLALAEAAREQFRERMLEEEGARRLLEGHVQTINQEVVSLNEKYEHAEKEKIEALTRLQVLSNYFREKESQLQKELGLAEANWLQKQSDDDTIYEQMRALREENEKYRSQNAALKKEICEQEGSYKVQVATLEEKANENWVSCRQAERRLKELQTEAGQLRNRLTLSEQNATSRCVEDSPGIPLMNNAESNGTDALMFPPPISPPFMMFSPPPGNFVPLLPPAFSPPLFPPPPEGRPPPLGRLSSPPPLPLDQRFSPPPPLPPRHHTFSPATPPLQPPPPLPVHKPKPRDSAREHTESYSINYAAEKSTQRRNKR